jgi:hypothetical protein
MTSVQGPGETDPVVVNARTVDEMAVDESRPWYRPTCYTVYPSGFDRVAVPERGRWLIHVVDAGEGWAVRWRGKCLNYRRYWEFEPPPKGRSADFLNRCRFSERGALHRARQVVDDLVVDGRTYDEFVTHVREREAAKARAALEAERRIEEARGGLARRGLLWTPKSPG